MNEISALTKETPQSSLAPFRHVGLQQEICHLEEGPHLTRLAP